MGRAGCAHPGKKRIKRRREGVIMEEEPLGPAATGQQAMCAGLARCSARCVRSTEPCALTSALPRPLCCAALRCACWCSQMTLNQKVLLEELPMPEGVVLREKVGGPGGSSLG